MVLDDAFANGKPKPGAAGFAVRGKGLEQPLGHLRGNAFSAILDFGHDLRMLSRQANLDLPSSRHRVAGVADQVVEHVDQSRRVDQNRGPGQWRGKLDGDQIKFTRKVNDFATMEIVAKRVEAAGENPEARPLPYGSGGNRLKLKVVRVDSEETAGEDGKGANAVDGDTSTIWHTQWQDSSPPHPHEIIIELGAPTSIKGFTYLPRQDDQVNGTIKEYEFYLSSDGKDFGQPVKKGTLGEGKEKKTVIFDGKQGRFVKLKALSEINEQPWTSAAEIEVIPQ